ncbi:helix-turn-helix domain-containing protein [Streptomyces sp. NPDC094143]|uniref:helix-turn-helix domain-containing protein n=1 Tax=Streptomyces sp. NPDC094143 TaxID=3155310 RepID=UPI00332791EC
MSARECQSQLSRRAMCLLVVGWEPGRATDTAVVLRDRSTVMGWDTPSWLTDLFVSSVGVPACEWEAFRVAYQPSPSAAGSSLPPLSRPQLAEARRVLAVELFEEGASNAEIARAVGVCAESVRRWRRVWEEGGVSALRRRAATGRPARTVGRPLDLVGLARVDPLDQVGHPARFSLTQHVPAANPVAEGSTRFTPYWEARSEARMAPGCAASVGRVTAEWHARAARRGVPGSGGALDDFHRWSAPPCRGGVPLLRLRERRGAETRFVRRRHPGFQGRHRVPSRGGAQRRPRRREAADHRRRSTRPPTRWWAVSVCPGPTPAAPRSACSK